MTVAGEAVDMAERLRAATTAPVIVAEPGSLRQLLQQAQKVTSLEEDKPDGA